MFQPLGMCSPSVVGVAITVLLLLQLVEAQGV